MGDDPVREAGAVGLLLEPARLLDRVVDPDRGLHVDALLTFWNRVSAMKCSRHVPEHLQPVDVAEDRVHPVALEPRVAEARVLQVPVVDVRVDEGQPGHGPERI